MYVSKMIKCTFVPVANVSNELENLSEEEFREKYGRPKPTKNTKIVFSCRSGRRSATVQEKMQSLGYTRYDEIPFIKIVSRDL